MATREQQIGGYIPTTNASKDNALNGIVAARISPAINTTGEYIAKSNLVRVVAIEDSNISLDSADPGMLIPTGSVEYFSVTPDTTIYIKGQVNISSIE